MAAMLGEDDDRVYVDLTRPSEDGAGSPAKASVTFRRTKGRDSLKRLSDILSAYIPVRAHDHQQPLIEETQDEATEAAASLPPLSPGGGSRGRGGYRTLMLLEVSKLRLNDLANSRENLLLQEDGAAESGAATATEASGEAPIEGDINGVALSKSGYAFLTFAGSPNILRLEVRPSQTEAPVSQASCRVMQVKLSGGVCLLPTDIRVHEEKLYVCGHLTREAEGKPVARSAIVRCDLECRVELASRELPQPRFYGFDIDPADGQLVVASPTPDGAAAQIFKMSADFKRKLFKIQLGSRNNSWNRPEFVACLGGGQCWVAAEQSDSQVGLAAGQVKHRLLSFPLRPPPAQPASAEAGAEQPPQQQQQQLGSTKSWMKVSSWKFEGIKPGRLLTIPGAALVGAAEDAGAAAAQDRQGDRLLMLSRDQGNIYLVSAHLGCTPLTHPASDGGQIFTAFCALHEPCCASPSPYGGSKVIDILAATKDSLYLLQAS